MVNEPTFTTATFDEWHNALCEVARQGKGSASTRQPWMMRAYNNQLTPSEAWEAFNNDELPR